MLFTKRTTEPSVSDPHYYTDNTFYKSGYGLPNCTCYAWGRWYELLGYKSNLCTGNAENWYGYEDGYQRGSTPRLGAIACWRSGKTQDASDGAGHVGVVEKIYKDGRILVSNSAYGGALFYSKELTNEYTYSTMTFQGFIYPPVQFYETAPENTIKYRVHMQDTGWTSWVSDKEIAGITGKFKRLEALQIDPAGSDIYVTAHMQDIGWKEYGKITKDTIIGTTGESRRLEALKMKGNFFYRVHVQGTGWSAWTKADGIITLGTVGQAMRIEAIQIETL